MANLTDAERAKRYRQRKAGKRVERSPRALRREDIEILWIGNNMVGRTVSLRTFYRQRMAALNFICYAPNETLSARVRGAPELVEYISKYTLISEWKDFVARLEGLGISVDRRHPLDT